MKPLLTHGLTPKGLIHISEVENGLKCNCICPNCNARLIAKNNIHNKKEWHFAHYNTLECEGALEAALHIMAKDILNRTKQIMLPAFHHDYNKKNRNSIFEEATTIMFDEIILEHAITIGDEKIVPDVIALKNGRKILIEIANTHFVDSTKKSKIKKLELPCIEINLAGQSLVEAELEAFFNIESDDIYWIANPLKDKKYLNHLGRLRSLELTKVREEGKKFQEYLKNTSLRILSAPSFFVADCPKKRAQLNELKNSLFYTHPILKQIVDGNKWNYKIYGSVQGGRHIFLNGEKIFIYPPEKNFDEHNTAMIKQADLFYAGLQKLISIHDDDLLGDCSRCDSLKEYLPRVDNGAVICGFKKSGP